MVRKKKLRVERKGYSYERNGKVIRVKATVYYIEDRGKRGRGKRLFKIHKGKLTRFGYSTDKPYNERRKALRRAVKEYGALSVYRMLNAQVVLRKRERKSRAKRVFMKDRDWIKKQYLGG